MTRKTVLPYTAALCVVGALSAFALDVDPCMNQINPDSICAGAEWAG